MLSYINGLHPEKYGELHKIIEQIVGKAIPLWDAMFAALLDEKVPRIVVKNTLYDTDGDDYRSDYSELPVVHPEPPNFEESEWLKHQLLNEGKVPVNLRNTFGKLQIIVKVRVLKFDSECGIGVEKQYRNPRMGKLILFYPQLANIHLTPEEPNYPGGSWHVEGTLNESICATALYYYESDNISESLLAFRTQLSEYGQVELPYPQSESRAVDEVYGFGDEMPYQQELGTVVTKQGRLLAFPNVYQRRVEPFHLADPTKPGYRKILALFLIDPYRPIISTANIPCQQKSWWAERVRGIGPLGNLPLELNQKIIGMVPDPIPLEEADEQREELMEERNQS